MSANLLLVVSAIYLYAGLEQGFKDNMWWLGVWGSYAVANICLIQTMIKS